MNLHDLQLQWLDAKESEARAKAHRLDIEAKMAEAAGVQAGSGGHDLGVLKAYARTRYHVDPEKADQVPAKASHLFRWKAELNLTAYNGAPDELKRLVRDAIEERPSKVSFERKEK